MPDCRLYVVVEINDIHPHIIIVTSTLCFRSCSLHIVKDLRLWSMELILKHHQLKRKVIIDIQGGWQFISYDIYIHGNFCVQLKKGLINRGGFGKWTRTEREDEHFLARECLLITAAGH